MKTLKKLAILALVALPSMASAVEHPTVDVRPEKLDYVLGEMVELTIWMSNPSAEDIEIPARPSVENGRIRLFVASDGPFREYAWPGPRVDSDGPGARVAPGDTRVTTATVLSVARRPTNGLMELYAREIREKYLETDYAFPRAGTYRIKAVLRTGDADVESRPVTIRVHKPEGADLEVWKVLEADPALGRFVQLGAPTGDRRSAEMSVLAKKLSDLSTSYPESRHAEDIRTSLFRYLEAVEELERRESE
jgi:hypothetical protein